MAPTSLDEVGDEIHATFDGKADETELDDETVCAVLRVANESPLDVLDHDVRLDARAARGIVERRPLATLTELDAVPYVGPVALGRLVDYAAAEGIACAAGISPIVRGRIVYTRTIHDEWRGAQPLAYTFWAKPGTDYEVRANGPGTANSPRVSVVGPLRGATFAGAPTLHTFAPESGASEFTVPAPGVYGLLLEEESGRDGFVDFSLQPVGWVFAPTCEVEGLCDCFDDADCGDGAECLALDGLVPPPGLPTGRCAPTFPAPYDPAACSEPAGVYRTVAFTAEEACATLDVLNHAPWSVLRDRSRGWHRTIFHGAPGEVAKKRASRWTSLAQVARQTVEFGGVGSATMRALKEIATEGGYSEPVTDTVESTFLDRFENDEKEVVLEDALVTELEPGSICGTLRDEAGGSHFLRFCSDHSNLTGVVGERVFITGVLSHRDGLWTIDGTFVVDP